MNTLPTLIVKHGHPLATSIQVAEHFGKQHKNVLRSIQNLDCSEDFTKLNFELCYQINPLQNNKRTPYYEMTRDGFTFLAFGFTGKEAAEWKEAYINAFNQMEAALRDTRIVQPETVTLDKDDLLALQSELIKLLRDKNELLELKATTQTRRRNFTAAEKLKLDTHIAQGTPPATIAKILNRSVSSVQTYIRRRQSGGAK